MLPSPKSPRATIVSAELARAYDDEMAIVQGSHRNACEAISKYWWSLYKIWHGNLWRAKFEEGHAEDWLQEIMTEPWGPSRSDFFATMGAVERLKKMGLTEAEVKVHLGQLSTALKGDLKEAFSKRGKGELLPEVKSRIEEGGETTAEFANRLLTLGPVERRKEVTRLIKENHIYATQGVYDERLGRVMANVVWESRENGIEIMGTITMSFTETTEPRQSKKGNYMPEIIGRWLLSKLGVSDQS